MTPVQSTSSLVSAASSVAATLTGVTAGNTVVAAVFYTDANGANATATVPTGFTACVNPASIGGVNPTIASCGAAIFQQANSAGGSITCTMNSPGGAGALYATLSLTEWAFTSAPLDKTGGPGTSQGALTTTASTPTTGTLANASETAIAVLSLTSANGLTNAGISNPPTGYTALAVQQNSSAEAAGESCYKDSGGTTGQSATWTYTSDATQQQTVQVIATFVQSSPGTKSLTGQTTTSSEGTVSRAVTYGLTGQTATFTEGTITKSTGGNVTLSLTGQTATLTEGTVLAGVGYSLNDGVPLTGQTATFAEGSPSNSVTYGLTGQTATFSEGTLLRASGYSVTGQSSTFTEGVILGSGALSLVGQTATFTEGSISVSVGGNVTIALTGQTITSSEGTLLGSSGYSVTGQTSTFTEGLLNYSLLTTLSGQSITAFPGTVTQSGGTSLGPAAFFMVGFICNVGTLTVKDQY